LLLQQQKYCKAFTEGKNTVSNKQLRTIIRIVHLVTAALLIALVYSAELRASQTYVTLIQLLIIPVIGISGVAMWKQAALSKIRRRTPVQAAQ
jgi:hypothetical protein